MRITRILFLTILFAVVTVILNAPAITPKSASAQTNIDNATQVSIIAISAGASHTCALTVSGGVKCWGDNYFGQLGDGTTTDRYTPVDVPGLSNGVTAIAAGSMHTCALVNGGGVKCWGENGQGQLGDGTTTDRHIPAGVSGLGSEVAAITAGSSHTCALMSNGGVKCWGENSHGQLGDGTTTGRYTPVSVSELGSSVTVIAAGAGYTCAITSNDGVKCWGINNYGQLGDGTTTDRYIPVDVSGLGSVVIAISAGNEHTCALESSGSVKCWGANGEGQLGDGTTTVRYAPVNVAGLGIDVTAVTAGGRHTCALMIGGGAKCWGSNYHGELGDGTSGSSRLTAINVAGLTSGVVAIDAGFSFTCAIGADGGIRCWGEDSDGKLGNNMQTYFRFAPTEVSTLTSEVNSVTAGERHTCARTSAGGVLCWGDQPLLGDGIDEGRFVPVAVTGLASGVTAIAAGGEGGEGGEGHTCALTASGTAHCWGGNFYRQLGTGTEYNGPRLLPVVVTGLGSGGVSAIAPGDAHTCAIITGGSVYCWGTIGGVFPAVVSGLIGTASAISSGYGYSCALTTEGVFCWGTNRYGQLGDGTTLSRSTPVAVNGLSTDVTSVATGFLHTCARTNTGGVKCWGSNASGELGDGTTTDRLTPVDVVGMTSGIDQVTVGGNHSCALTSLGGVLCWGLNDRGQLGDGTTTTHLTPVRVSGLDTGIASISAGAHHTCAVTTSGSVKCWGANFAGQLGVNPGWSPVDVIFPEAPLPPLDGQQILANPSWEAGEDPRVDSRWQWQGVSSADDCFAWTYDSTDGAGPPADGNRFLVTHRNGKSSCTSFAQDVERYPLQGETYTFRIAARAPVDGQSTTFDMVLWALGNGISQQSAAQRVTVERNQWSYHQVALAVNSSQYTNLRAEIYLTPDTTLSAYYNFDDAVLVGPQRGSVSGGVLTALDKPLEGVTLVTQMNGRERTVRTDASGAFLMSHLAPGTYIFTPRAPGLTFEPPAHQVTVGQEPVLEVQFHAIDTVPPVVTIVTPQNLFRPGPGKIAVATEANDPGGGTGIDYVEFYVSYDGVSHFLGRKVSDYSAELEIPLELPSQKILVAAYAYDRAGNRTPLGNNYIWLDYRESDVNPAIRENWVHADRRAYINQLALTTRPDCTTWRGAGNGHKCVGIYQCGTASATMLLAMNGRIDRGFDVLSATAYRLYTGYSIDHFKSILSAEGLSVDLKPNSSGLGTAAWEEIVREIDSNRPVLLITQRLGGKGHWIVIVGYREQGDERRQMIVYDPYGHWQGAKENGEDGSMFGDGLNYDTNLPQNSESYKGRWAYYNLDDFTIGAWNTLLLARPVGETQTSTVQISSPTSPPDEVTIEMPYYLEYPADAVDDIDFISGTFTISGVVTLVGGHLLSNATITLASKYFPETDLQSSVTNSQGSYRFSDIRPGYYLVKLHRIVGAPVIYEVRVDADKTVNIPDVQLEPESPSFPIFLPTIQR